MVLQSLGLEPDSLGAVFPHLTNGGERGTHLLGPMCGWSELIHTRHHLSSFWKTLQTFRVM